MVNSLGSQFHTGNVHNRWTIVLAGGEGVRLRPFVKRRYGELRPKQYCTFTGTRSMLEHTLGRASALCGASNLVTVIGTGHGKYLGSGTESVVPGRVVEQPNNLGTATGVFLGLAYPMALEPEATVVIMPSDHFVHPEDRFLDGVHRLCSLAEEFPMKTILLGAAATAPECEYGWIKPMLPDEHTHSHADHRDFLPVKRFVEKPGPVEAKQLYRAGCWWNTMIVAAKAANLWKIGLRLMPHIVEPLESFRQSIARRSTIPKSEADALRDAFATLSAADFSRSLLQEIPGECILYPLRQVTWSDWGNARRIRQTLAEMRQAGHRPVTRFSDSSPRRVPAIH